MFFQFLTAVVFVRCLQETAKKDYRPIVMGAWYRSKCSAVDLASINWPKQNISALSIAVESPANLSDKYISLPSFHDTISRGFLKTVIIVPPSKIDFPSNVWLPEDRNKMFWPIFALGLWPETFKASFSRTNQTANKRRRQKKCVKIFLNFTYLHKTQSGQKTAGNLPNFFLRYLLARCLGVQLWMPVEIPHDLVEI